MIHENTIVSNYRARLAAAGAEVGPAIWDEQGQVTVRVVMADGSEWSGQGWSEPDALADAVRKLEQHRSGRRP